MKSRFKGNSGFEEIRIGIVGLKVDLKVKQVLKALELKLTKRGKI